MNIHKTAHNSFKCKYLVNIEFYTKRVYHLYSNKLIAEGKNRFIFILTPYFVFIMTPMLCPYTKYVNKSISNGAKFEWSVFNFVTYAADSLLTPYAIIFNM